uniref:Neuropeptide Y receptor type 2 n=1 Tax=Pinctada imbricata TaxID=66713 RepID=A0A0U3SWV3_PINIB|nr:neuropeptide Y receptor type 2 [Pinctada imbricata]
MTSTSNTTVMANSFKNENATDNVYGIYDQNGLNRIPALIFSTTLLVVGTIGNAHALIINIQRYRERTTRRNNKNPYVVFVLSLAILDLFVCTFVLPLDIIDTCTHFTLLSRDWCKTFRYFQCFLHISSILHVLVISVHCWRRVCYPHGAQIGRTLAVKLCLGCNIFAFFPSIPTAVMSGYATRIFNGEHGQVCFISDAFNGTKWPTVYIGLIAIGFAVCVFVICLSYIALIRFRCQVRHQRDSTSKKEKKDTGKTTATLIILTVIFLVSYIPFLILGLIAAIDENFREGWNVATFATYRIFARFPHLNNILNPFIYGCKDPHFKHRLIQMYSPYIPKCFCPKQEENQIEISK